MPELLPSDLNEVVRQVAPYWEHARSGHVLLTGGTGFIGKWLVETFLRANAALRLDAAITILTRDPQRFQTNSPHLADHPSVRLLQGDILSAEVGRERFTHIIHAAADARRPTTPGEAFLEFDTITGGTRRILETCLSPETKAFLFLSSGAVYGRMPATVNAFAESYPGAPSTDDRQSGYGQAKRAAEFLCTVAGAQASIRMKIARCFAFIGPHLPLDGPFAAGNFMRDVLRGRPVRICGDGRTVRSYLYAADMAAWLWSILLDPRASGLYNVGSDQPVTIRELAETIADAVSPRAGVEAGEAQTGEISRYVPSIERARSELGLSVWTPLAKAVDRTLQWHRGPDCQ